MAMLALKSSYAVPQNVSSYRQQAAKSAQQQAANFASPTESTFSVRSSRSEGGDDVASWDERKVGDWLKSIGAERYVNLFRENNITGENLMDIDQTTLKEMGIKRVGDRVRIGSHAKLFRHRDYQRRRTNNRDSVAALDPQAHAPPSSNSPRGQRSRLQPSKDKPNYNSRANSRPTSPRYNEGVAGRGYLSPRENAQRDQASSYFGPTSGKSTESTKTTRIPLRNAEAPYSARSPLSASSIPGSSTAALPPDKPWIRVVYDNGTSSVVSLEGVTTFDEVMSRTLKKGNLDPKILRTYCFWLLDGTDPNPAYTRRLDQQEALRVCNDKTNPERERLMVRKIHMGEPDDAQIYAAANLAVIQQAAQTSHSRSQQKIQRMLGENSISLSAPQLPASSYPMSPGSMAERERHLSSAAKDLERSESKIQAAPRRRPGKNMKEWNGGRPPSELIIADTTTYFPDADKAQIEKISRLSIRRSQRLSRATSRLSMMSNFSVGSSIVLPGEGDVPALPSISDTFLKEGGVRARPLSIVRMGRPISSYRDSMASSMLEPLDEESSLVNSDIEPDRKSYISFGADSGPESATVSITDPSGHTSSAHSYFDEASPISVASHTADDSLNSQLAKAIEEDGEEPDEELAEFLTTDSWDNIRYIRGKLIGQGSFGSVYLALHAFTAELMAVKQVELPSTAGTAIDAKKNTMVEALKREIALLRELKHPHIVSYLGSSSDTEKNTLNIFLEYIPGGSIAKMLVDFGSLSEDIVSKFVRQILIGLAYLHSQDIIHRDIKGANILVDNHGSVKISDFGISKRVQDSKTLLTEGEGAPKSKAKLNNRVSLQGSVFWMAPEVVKQTAYTRKADIWSLGCLIVEMLTGSHPHPNCTQLQAIFKIGGRGLGGVQNDPSPDMPEKAGEKARELLRATFRIEHEKRPEAEELLKYPFVQVKA
ncbi:hypothetical protein FH972_025755 [Carpinus fangiana]|uniref:mitogen-activated protein kinase kinase kinase n=1 Tax=Carpinus fangiana TaxID=176857 RepID=A0A5N6L1Y1_9ROSI|nr:hypothetical protein FH972_025755 [Carpinus fangiana]